MQFIRYVLLFLLLGFCLNCTAHCDEIPHAAPNEVGMSSEKLNQINALVQAAVNQNQTAGAVVVVARRGSVIRVDAVGKMDIASGKVMRPDSIFRIQSMSKPITTVAALMLVEEGKFKLDDPVSKYLPELKGLRVVGDPASANTPVAAITIRDLMRHTSGFTYGIPGGTAVEQLYIDNNVPDAGSDLADMVRKLGKLPLKYKPGTQFNYSLSIDVLGRLVEVESGKRLDLFLRDRIFRPLDMRDTGFVVPRNRQSRLASSYQPNAAGTLTATDLSPASRYLTQPKLLSGGGGLVSTGRDYLRFCQMLLNGGELQGKRLLRPETVREMTTNQLPAEALPMSLGGFRVPGLGYGLGVSVKMGAKSAKPDVADGEFGWSGAASTFFWVAPKSELIVIILQQIQPLNIGLQLKLRPAIYAAIDN